MYLTIFLDLCVLFCLINNYEKAALVLCCSAPILQPAVGQIRHSALWPTIVTARTAQDP